MFLRSIQFVFAMGSKRQTRGSRRNGASASLLQTVEVVEERCLLSIDSAWIAQGPGPTINAQVAIPPTDPVNGAIQAIAAHPTNANIVYVGTVNGGVWKTTNATTSNTWTPLTDTLQSQSIGAIEFDVTDPTLNTLLAGTGRWSNYATIGDDAGLLYYTTNGGTSWTTFTPAILNDQKISGVAARGNTWLVTSVGGGVYRSTNGGATFTSINNLNGLGTGGTQDLAADPSNPNRFYVSQGSGRIFRTDDAGATWTDVTGAVTGVSGAERVRLSVNASVGAVYVAVGAGGAGGATKVWRSANQGGTWTPMDDVFVHNGGQQFPNTSLAADPTNPNLVYVGGDRIANGPFTALSYRGDASAASGNQWTILVDNGATNTAPHADTRDMAFRADGTLLESDDGGMYRHTNPQGTGSWVAAAGNIAAFEAHDVAYNSLNNTLVIGLQDNGTHLQTTSGNTQWSFISGGDGGDVAIDSVTLAGSNQSIVYSSSQNLLGFQRVVYDSNNNAVSSTPLASITSPTFVTPIELNSINPSRLLIGGADALFESTDQGTTNTNIGGPGQPGFLQNAMVYGGSLAGTPNPDLIYVAAESTVYKRTTSGGAITATTTLPAGAGQVNDVAIDPANYNTVFATDNDQVFMSSNGGTSWSDITGNLGSLSSLNEIRTVVYVPGLTPYVAVGTRSGVFASPASSFGTWVKPGTALPDVLIFDLVYNATDDVLVAGTFGRGVWTQSKATSFLVNPTPTTPTMLGPLGTLTQPFPLFEWTLGANADHFELQVDNLTTNQPNYYMRNVTGVSHLAVTQFAEADYRARVRTAGTDGSFSGWSEYVLFTVDVPTPLKPVVNRPTGNITDSFPDFGWTGDTFAATYTLWVNNATTGTRVIYRTSYPETSYVHFNPLADGVYRVWVKAYNAIGEASAWSESVDFTIRAPLAVAPTITGPVAVSGNTSPRITWNAVSDAAKYDLWVDNLSTGAAQFIRQSSISRQTPYFDATNLPQGTFRAWVRTANGNNVFSQWSLPYTFTIDIPVPSTPTMTAPTGTNGNGIVTTANPTFRWTAADRAVKYDLWVNNITTGQAQIIRQTSLTTTEYVALNNLPQGNYRAWVRGINSANEVGEWSTALAFVLDEPTPTVPVIVAPVPNPAGVVVTTTPTFTWTNTLNAPFYEFRLDDTTINRTNVIRVTNIKSNSYTIPDSQRLTEHTYVATVRGVNSSGEMSDWSAAYTVRIDIPNPSTPTILNPSGTSKNRTPTFEWTHSSGSVRYEILVRDLERGENIVLQVNSFSLNPDGTTSFYTLPNSQALRPGTYRFWIRGFNSLGTASSWSDARTFVISASLDLKDLKIVEPAKLQSAEEFYADAEQSAVVETDASRNFTVPATVDLNATSGSEVSSSTMPDMMIEKVMQSLGDPTSPASAMLSEASLGASQTETSQTETSQTETTSDRPTTAVAALFALAVMPVRRKRREE